MSTSSPLVVVDTWPGRGPKWVPKCIDFGLDLVDAVTPGWWRGFGSPLSSGETGGGMKGGRWWWWLNLVGSEEKAVKGLLVVKVLIGTVYIGTGVGRLVEEYFGAEENTVKGAAVVEWWNGPRGMCCSD